jgi:predicted component of type VI protein secretion system
MGILDEYDQQVLDMTRRMDRRMVPKQIMRQVEWAWMRIESLGGFGTTSANAHSGVAIHGATRPTNWDGAADWLVTFTSFMGAIEKRGSTLVGKVKRAAQPTWKKPRASLFRVRELVEAVLQASGPDPSNAISEPSPSSAQHACARVVPSEISA